MKTGTIVGIVISVIVLGGITYLIYRQVTKDKGTGSDTDTKITITTKADAIAQLKRSIPSISDGISSYDEAFLIAWAKATLTSDVKFTYLNKTYSTKQGNACTAAKPCV